MEYIKEHTVRKANDIEISTETRSYIGINDEIAKQLGYADTSELLANYGWEVYDPTQMTETLESAIESKLAELYAYDNSDAVNNVILNGQNFWKDKYERASLQNLFQTQKRAGENSTTIWNSNTPFDNFDIDTAIAMLDTIEIYAYACYNNTARHAANIKNLKTIDEVHEYDFTTGYPEMLNLSMN